MAMAPGFQRSPTALAFFVCGPSRLALPSQLGPSRPSPALFFPL